MKIKYEFLAGQAVEVEVSEEIGIIILQLERDTYNSDRRETRRHTSLSNWNDLDERPEMPADPTVDVEAEIIKAIDASNLHRAIKQLSPDEQALTFALYLDEPAMTQAEYAKILGISENAVQLRASAVRKKLRKLIK